MQLSPAKYEAIAASDTKAIDSVLSRTFPCPVCGSDTGENGYKYGQWKKQRFDLRRCSQCNFSFISNPLTDYQEIYSEAYYRGQAADPLINYVYELECPAGTIRIHEWQGILDVVKHLVPLHPSTRWLDFGCGNGGLVRYCRERANCSIMGFDEGWIRHKVVEANIPCLDRPQLDQLNGTFDVVTAIEVLEHVPDPLEVLRRIRAALKPGGLFFYTTGNARPYRRRLSEWRYVVPETHVSFYEPESLRRALVQSGFQPEFRGYLPGFTSIIRYKILKNLRVHQRSRCEKIIPWNLLARLTDSYFGITAHPLAWAV